MTSPLEKIKELQTMLNEELITRADYDQFKDDLLRGNFAAAKPENNTNLDSAETSLAVRKGDEIGPTDQRFRLETPLGEGGMGEVWSALEITSGRGKQKLRALKLLHEEYARSPRYLDILQNEADIVKELSHPNIVNVHGMCRGQGGIHFIVMECLQGESLKTILRERGEGGIPWPQIINCCNRSAAPELRLGRASADSS